MNDTVQTTDTTVAPASIDLDPFDSLLNLEETFYQQGYRLGEQDGTRQGLAEGRVFGMEQAFDKFSEMARLHGHAIVIGNRIPAIFETSLSSNQNETNEEQRDDLGDLAQVPDLDLDALGPEVKLEPLSGTARMEKHVRTLYALTEPASLSVQNQEDYVSEFDDRFKRAQAKVTILSKMVGYEIALGDHATTTGKSGEDASTGEAGKVHAEPAEQSIEDVSILQARH